MKEAASGRRLFSKKSRVPVAKSAACRQTIGHWNWSVAFHDFGLARREKNTVGRASRGLKKRCRERLDARLMISQMASDTGKDDSSRIFARLRRFLRDGISRAHAGWNQTGRK